MIDTVNFCLTAADVHAAAFVDETPRYLDDVCTHQNHNTGEIIITGNLGGLKVTANRWQLKVNGGSLCKSYLGNNYKTMTRRDIEKAIQWLSDGLHQPIDRAAVTRLDVGCTLITQHPAEVYYNHLGMLAGAKRLPNPSGLYYTKRDEVVCVYDKNREQTARGETPPMLYRGKNVLRYEHRFRHRIARALKVPAVTGGTLFNEQFYIVMVKRMKDTYNAISKINDIQLNFQAMKGKRQLYNYGLLNLVNQMGGEVAFLEQITAAQNRGEITAKQAFDMRQAVKRACQEREGLTVRAAAIDELNNKIVQAVKYYR